MEKSEEYNLCKKKAFHLEKTNKDERNSIKALIQYVGHQANTTYAVKNAQDLCFSAISSLYFRFGIKYLSIYSD